jgi:hypothetical protein
MKNPFAKQAKLWIISPAVGLIPHYYHAFVWGGMSLNLPTKTAKHHE